jgi:hypothetical protein
MKSLNIKQKSSVVILGVLNKKIKEKLEVEALNGLQRAIFERKREFLIAPCFRL